MRPHRPPTVDVCVTYYQKPAYFSHLVDALQNQTVTDFHVIAVNDGSPDEQSNRVFEQQAVRVSDRCWDFFRQENSFVDAARNNAAWRGTGDLILFVDADDVPARHAVERMRDAITRSGDDALICASYIFAGSKPPYDIKTGEVAATAFAIYIPLGIDLVGGIIHPNVFGASMFIVRRTAFEQMGGFRELRGAGHEDWEFYVRLALAGYRIDVLPEILLYYRKVEDGISHKLPPEAARRRLLDAYEEKLGTIGLPGAALGLAGLYQSNLEMKTTIEHLTAKLRRVDPHSRFAYFSGAANGFEEPTVIGWLRDRYRQLLPLETRLAIHTTFFKPFIGPHKSPPQ
jgi:GT2 family glycosyltransferase